MKKTYKVPTIKVNIVAVHQMLCGSPDGLMSTSGENATGSDNEENNLGKEDFGW